MAKPIFVLTLKTHLGRHDFGQIKAALTSDLNNEYHVIIAIDMEMKATSKFECFNDCKGLPDIDIEKLINEYTNGQSSEK